LYNNHEKINTWLREASRERIARSPLRTTAEWVVIDDATIGFHPTSAGTRIRALVLMTSSVLRALRINDAFRLAVRRDPHERFLTRAHSLIVHGAAQAVRPARCGRARVLHVRLGIRFRLESAYRERISDVSRFAGTRGNVIDDGTLRSNATYARARIVALVADAGLVRGTIRT
jgi:hypothetical protein